MRPLVHPAVDELTAEGILYALADPVRAQIFAEIAVSQCAQTCKSFLEVSDKRVPKSTLSKHFGILREAGLIRSARVGKELHNVLREEVVKERFDALVTAIINAHKDQELYRRSKTARGKSRGGSSRS
jgi:DNA-binding transcriptional ArsR family regulator